MNPKYIEYCDNCGKKISEFREQEPSGLVFCEKCNEDYTTLIRKIEDLSPAALRQFIIGICEEYTGYIKRYILRNNSEVETQ